LQPTSFCCWLSCCVCGCQVAEWIGARLADPYRYKYSVTDNDMPLPKHQQPPALAEG